MYGIKTVTTEIVYPAEVGVKNFVTDFGADPTGVTDCWQKLKDAIATAADRHILYIPNGTYRIAKAETLDVKKFEFGGYIWIHRVRLQFQSYKAVIKFDDNLFTNAANPIPFLRFGALGAEGNADPNAAINGLGNTAFFHRIEGGTFDAGSGNPGLIILDWQVSNQGRLKNLIFKCTTPCHTALGQLRTNSGPGYIGNIQIIGPFVNAISQTGFDFAQIYENILVDGAKNALRAYVFIVANLRNCHFRVSEQVIKANEGFLTLDNCTFESLNTSATSTLPAIEVELDDVFQSSRVFARNISISGWRTLYRRRNNGQESPPRNYYDEWHNLNSIKLYPEARTVSPRLPIKETPFTPYYPQSDWVYLGDPNAGVATWQANLDNFPDKPVRYCKDAPYLLTSSLTIPDHVRLIIGGGAGFDCDSLPDTIPGFLINSASSNPLHFWELSFFAGNDTEGISSRNQHPVIINRSTRQLTMESITIHGHKYVNESPPGGQKSGDLFLEEFQGCFWLNYPQNVWARHLNSEADFGVKNKNNGGNVWVFGWKSENAWTAFEATNGSRTEILGLFSIPYFTSSYNSINPYFDIVDSDFFLVGLEGEQNPGQRTTTVIRNTRNGVSNNILQADIPKFLQSFGATLSTYLSKKIPRSFF